VAGLHQRMKFRFKKWHAFAIGFPVGLLSFAVLREVVWAFQARPAGEVLSFAISKVGRLGWIDTTLVTGLAAVTAAALSVREVRRQIRSSNAASTQQIVHSTKLDQARRDARRAANRAVLPLTLAALSQYAETNAHLLVSLREKVNNGILPKGSAIPTFTNLPSGIIAALKEMIETVEPSERRAFTRLLMDIQVESSRLSGIEHSNKRGGIITTSNIDAHILGQSAIYARTASLYDFARGKTEEATDKITKKQVATGLFLVGVHEIREDLIERYNLDTDDPWNPYSQI
jgi:hypothetical protein